MPPEKVNWLPKTAGLYIMPVVVRYGCSVKIAAGLFDEAVITNRCLLVLYSDAVTATMSTGGWTVTVVDVDCAPAVLIVRVTTSFVKVPNGSSGA
jgi:hypothetical protein